MTPVLTSNEARSPLLRTMDPVCQFDVFFLGCMKPSPRLGLCTDTVGSEELIPFCSL